MSQLNTARDPYNLPSLPDPNHLPSLPTKPLSSSQATKPVMPKYVSCVTVASACQHSRLCCCNCRRKGGILCGPSAPGQATQRCRPQHQPGWQLEAGAAAGQQGACPWGLSSLLQAILSRLLAKALSCCASPSPLSCCLTICNCPNSRCKMQLYLYNNTITCEQQL